MLIKIEGHHPLNGVYTPSGNPNAALPLMAAALMTEAPVHLHNVPRTLSVHNLLEVMLDFGTTVIWEGKVYTSKVPRSRDGYSRKKTLSFR